MNVFSIRDIENLTGIKAHTLRIWEQRHNLFNPKRKQSKHRFYDSDDLKYILRIAYLYKHSDLKISKIASLPEETIRELTMEPKPGAHNYGIYVNHLVEAALDFDQDRFEKVLQKVIDQSGFENAVFEIVFPLLKRIGMLWLSGMIHPVQEHFASSMVIKRMILAIDQQPKVVTASKRKVMLFAPQGEFHEIPILFMQYLLKKNGIPYVYLGQNVSLETIETVGRYHQVTELYFHLITNLTGCDIQQYLRKLSDLFPDRPILFSCCQVCEHTSLPVNVQYLQDEKSMRGFAM